MLNFDLTDALTFLTVVNEGNFAAAAKKWQINPSVISKRISRLEKNLGVQLLKRTTRQMILTEIGQNFYHHCERLQIDINMAASLAIESQDQPRGLLRINAPMSLGSAYLVPVIATFMRLYPDIQIELVLGSHFANFIEHGLDLAIHIKEPPNTNTLKARQIGIRKTGVYASPDYFASHSIPQTPKDLTQHNCLIYQSEPGHKLGSTYKHEWKFIEKQKTYNVAVSGNLMINSSQALVAAAVSGLGIIKISDFMVTKELNNKTLINVLDEYCLSDLAIYAVYPNQRFLPKKVRVFIDFLITSFSN